MRIYTCAYCVLSECIYFSTGMRFAMLEMKLALAQFLHNYSVTLSDKSCARIQFEPASFLSCPKGGIWLNVNKR